MAVSVPSVVDLGDQALTYTGPLAVGNLVYSVSAGVVARADSGAGGTMPAVGVVVELPAGTTGICVLATSGAPSVFSGLTAGTVYYAHTSGTIATTAGTVIQPIGVAISATQLQLFNDAFTLPNIWRGSLNCETVDSLGNVTVGLGAPATTATAGFPYIPVVAGTPTGVPTTKTGFSPIVFDSTGVKLWVYDFVAAGWKGVVVS